MWIPLFLIFSFINVRCCVWITREVNVYLNRLRLDEMMGMLISSYFQCIYRKEELLSCMAFSNIYLFKYYTGFLTNVLCILTCIQCCYSRLCILFIGVIITPLIFLCIIILWILLLLGIRIVYESIKYGLKIQQKKVYRPYTAYRVIVSFYK